MTTSEQDFRGVERDEDRGGLSVRPMPAADGRAQDAHPTHSTHSAESHPYFARVRRVRAAVHAETARNRVTKPARGEIITTRTATGAEFYAYAVVDGKRRLLGKFRDRGLAKAVIVQAQEAIAELKPATIADIAEEFVSDMVQAVPVEERRAMFNTDRDPIGQAACRLRLCFTLDQVGRLYGVSRERIRQVQDESLKKIKRGGSLAMYEHQTLGKWTIWDQLEEGADL